MAEKQKTEYPSSTLIITLIVLVFALVYAGTAWFPGVVRLVFNIEGTTGDGQFGGFGTIGDFFGGLINPILTFITIYLLLVSIRLQQEELEETRKEMKAATQQAEISAKAVVGSFQLERALQRPFLRAFRSEVNNNFGYFSLFKESPGDDDPQENLYLRVRLNLINAGKSPCRVTSASFYKIIQKDKFSTISEDCEGFLYSNENFPHPKGRACGIIIKQSGLIFFQNDYILPDEIYYLEMSDYKIIFQGDLKCHYSIMEAIKGSLKFTVRYENLLGEEYFVGFNVDYFSVEKPIDDNCNEEYLEVFLQGDREWEIKNYFNSVHLSTDRDHRLETDKHSLISDSQKKVSTTSL